MLLIFQGPSPMNLIAGDLQAAIHAQIGECEHSSTVQERSDGCYALEDRLETLDEVHTRLAEENNVGVIVIQDMLARGVLGLQGQPKRILTGKVTKRSGPRQIFVSPSLKTKSGRSITIADFHKPYRFGNGVTANYRAILQDGTSLFISWCVLDGPTSVAFLADPNKQTLLRQLMEG
jgi:hypothetical protein